MKVLIRLSNFKLSEMERTTPKLVFKYRTLYDYQKKFLKVMVNNSTNSSKTNNQHLPQVIEHKNKIMTYELELQAVA